MGLKDFLHNNPQAILTPDKSGKGYICPICESGSGKNGTGLTTQDGIHFTCWSKGCFRNADVIEIYQKTHNLPDYSSTLQALAEHFGIAVESPEKENDRNMEKAAGKSKKEKEPEIDYSSFFLQAEKDIEKTTYWQKRGLSLATVKAFHLGYVEQWRHPKAPQNTPTSPRLIIPTSRYSYLARDTREKDAIPEAGKQYEKMKVGKVNLFHTASLLTGKPVFVVEGELDAMSVYEAGYEAVGLGSTANAEKFAEYVKTLDTVPPLILALDNDPNGQGQEATEKLHGLLGGIPHTIANPYGMAKDANEALTRNRSFFAQNLEKAKTECLQIACRERETERQAYIAEHSVKGKMQAFIDRSINAVVDCFPTGFPILDSVLDGGLREGLYVLGAVPSLGKTTFALQVCDQVAAAGYDALIFSLEMSEYELMAKSLSRYTLLQEKKKRYSSIHNALSVRDITDRNRYTQDTAKRISEAIEAYQTECGERVFIFEGNGDYGVKEIDACIKRHISLTGKKPVVMIDYLQILPPYDVHFSEKQNTDKAISELKRITRSYKIPVIVVSSLSRSSYSNKVTLSSYKESGAIEYGTDILIGLYLEGVGESDFDEQEKKSKPQRDIVLSILKNRNGVLGNVKFTYFPRVNYFQEVEQVKTVEKESDDD